MNFMPQIAKLSGQVIYIDTLSARIGITSIGKQTDFQNRFLRFILAFLVPMGFNVLGLYREFRRRTDTELYYGEAGISRKIRLSSELWGNFLLK
jgi:hypothetical protein